MEQKILKNTSKKKLFNHLTKNGQKEVIEKVMIKSNKQIQKHNKKNYNEIIKLSRLNTLPTFKIIKLTNSKTRKKSTKEIPMFISRCDKKLFKTIYKNIYFFLIKISL